MLHEKRLTDRLTGYWERLKSERKCPLSSAFDPMSIADIWPYCMRVSVQHKPSGAIYTYEALGNEVVGMLGKNVTGEIIVPNLAHVPGATIVSKAEFVLQTQQPAFQSGQFINLNHKMVKYRSCILPFVNMQNQVNDVVVGLSWKLF